jgi:hypothetical protein
MARKHKSDRLIRPVLQTAASRESAGESGLAASTPRKQVTSKTLSVTVKTDPLARVQMRTFGDTPHIRISMGPADHLDQLSIFARSLDEHVPVTHMPIMGIAVFGIKLRSELGGGIEGPSEVLMEYALGVVGTDHVGYASFDLRVLRVDNVLMELESRYRMRHNLPDGHTVTIHLIQLLALPYLDRMIAFDALKEGSIGPNYVTLRMEMDSVMLAKRSEYPPMVSMQTPSILDWRLSPGSFSMSGALLIGADGCEAMIPANLATQLYRLQQVVYTNSEIKLRPDTVGGLTRAFGEGAPVDPSPDPPRQKPLARLAYIVDYQVEWFSIGHSLGQIAYSLPLAPGEKIKMAVVDWSRKADAMRSEDTKFVEKLDHEAIRDQAMSEAVDMVVRENQSGSSFMAGISQADAASIPLQYVSIGISSVKSLGFASTDSDGVRTAIGNTSRNVSDAFHQASSALRELRSTVIVQDTQIESAKVSTRTVANYNHSHAMTILYYEVLHHHRVLTRATNLRPALLLQQELVNFDRLDNIVAYRSILQAYLLDKSLADCFKALDSYECAKATFARVLARQRAAGGPVDERLVGDITLRVVTGATGPLFLVQITIVTKAGGERVICSFTNPGAGDFLDTHAFPIKPNTEIIVVFHPTRLVRWDNVQGFEVLHYASGRTGATPHWIISEAHASTTDPTNAATVWTMLDSTSPVNLIFGRALQFPVSPFTPVPKSAEDLLSDPELCCLARLRAHLKAHLAFYSRLVWQLEDPIDRAARLAQWTIDGTDKVADILDNKIVDVVDDFIVMPLRGSGYLQEQVKRAIHPTPNEFATLETDNYIEQLITLPSRGVFAEAKLGHCNASEIIDTTRFWDWQASPIPDDTAPIAPLSTDSRGQATPGTQPTGFPQSIVNIATPQSLPDPTGFATVGSILSALGPFRDATGIKELGSFLQGLSSQSTQLASEALKGANMKSLLDNIRGAPELTPEQKTNLIDDLLTGQVKQSTQSPSPGTQTSGTNPSSTTGTPSTGPTGTGATTSGSPSSKPGGTAGVPPTHPATPQKGQPSSTLSSKSKKVTFDFMYKGLPEPMRGRWKVELIGTQGGYFEEHRMVDTFTGVSGVDIGNRIEMYIPTDFGEGQNVKIQIKGTILSPSIMKGMRMADYVIDAWSMERTAEVTIPSDKFSASLSFDILQTTKEGNFTIVNSRQDADSSLTSKDVSAGLEVGVEEATEIGGGVGPATGKEAVRISAKGTFAVKSTTGRQSTTTSGRTEQVVFSVKYVDEQSPLEINPI